MWPVVEDSSPRGFLVVKQVYHTHSHWDQERDLLSPESYGVIGQVAIEGGAYGGKVDNRVVFRGRLRCYSVKETGVNQFLQEKLDVSEFRILDAKRFKHAQVAVLYSHKDRAEVFEIRPHQVESSAKIFDRLGF